MKQKDALRRLPTRSLRSGVICLGLLAALGIGQIASAVKADLSMTHQPPSSIEPLQDLVLTFSVSGDCEGDPPGASPTASPQGRGIWVDKSCGPLSGGVTYDSGTGQNTVAATFAPRDSQGLRAGTVTIPGSGLPSGATLTYTINSRQSRTYVTTEVGVRPSENCLVRLGRTEYCHVYQPTGAYRDGPTESTAISTAYWSATIRISGTPAAPNLLSPSNGSSTSNTKPTFDWSDVTDPSGLKYQLQVDDSGTSFPSPEINKSGLTASKFSSTQRLAKATYTWRVRAIDAAGNVGPWSQTFQLTIV